ncbi:MAG: hypothetical protein IJT95_03440 [Abditibacteriota bacterium]|nr:hypothetical protein [Abditibacteriota bacterium]
MKKTTDFDLHLRRLFLWEYFFEILSLGAVFYVYRYVFFLHGAPEFLRLLMGLAAPVVIVLILVRINLLNFKGVLASIPSEALEPAVVEHIIKMTAFMNVREDAMQKAAMGIGLMDREQLLEISPRLMLRFIRLCYVSGKKVLVDAAEYAARITDDPAYKAAVDNNGVRWITGMMDTGDSDRDAKK